MDQKLFGGALFILLSVNLAVGWLSAEYSPKSSQTVAVIEHSAVKPADKVTAPDTVKPAATADLDALRERALKTHVSF